MASKAKPAMDHFQAETLGIVADALEMVAEGLPGSVGEPVLQAVGALRGHIQDALAGGGMDSGEESAPGMAAGSSPTPGPPRQR